MARRRRTYSPKIRERARQLRQAGQTYSEIIAELGGDIPKNTISSWVRDIKLTAEQRTRIKQKEREAGARGRQKAAEWHREQKRARLQAAEDWAAPIAQRASENSDVLMLMAAALWLGEGEKRDDVLAIANSDPRIIKGWLELLRRTFKIDDEKLACQIHISQGMPEPELKEFWSGVTGIPLDRFHKTYVDMRVKSLRHEGYKGVCRVLYFSAELRRRIGAVGWQVLDILSKKC